MDLQNGHLSEIEVVNNDTFVTITSIIYFQGCCGSDHILDCHFQQYFNYIVAVSFIGGGNWSTQRKSLTCRKSLANLIT
jgi:hypothetical protein